MSAKLLVNMFSLFTFMFLMYMTVSYFIYTGINERVNDICYDTAETVSTKGEFTEELYDHIMSDLSDYGDFDMIVNVTLQSEDRHIYDCRADMLFDLSLNPGDRIEIAVFDKNPSLFERITQRTLRPSAIKTAIVC